MVSMVGRAVEVSGLVGERCEGLGGTGIAGETCLGDIVLGVPTLDQDHDLGGVTGLGESGLVWPGLEEPVEEGLDSLRVGMSCWSKSSDPE